MFKHTGGFLIGLLLGGMIVFVGLKYHVVRASDGYHLIPKMSANFSEAYVDIREFTFADWDNHRPLAAAMVAAGEGDLLGESADQQLRSSLDTALRALNNRS